MWRPALKALPLRPVEPKAHNEIDESNYSYSLRLNPWFSILSNRYEIMVCILITMSVVPCHAFGTGQGMIGIEASYVYMNTKELVPSVEGSAARYLSILDWKTNAFFLGGVVRFRHQDWLQVLLKLGGSFNQDDGVIRDSDYMNPRAPEVTHFSTGPVSLADLQWRAETGFRITNTTLFVLELTTGYSGYFRKWEARGGEYRYPEGSGNFEDMRIIEYLVLSQRPYIGARTSCPLFNNPSFEAGVNVSYFSFVNDRDTHELRDMRFYDSYRFGWSIEIDATMRVLTGQKAEFDLFYRFYRQFDFTQTETKIETAGEIIKPAENPNFREVSHLFGIKIGWRIERKKRSKIINPTNRRKK